MSEFFSYRGGQLHAEEVPIARIAEAVGTPCYVYSAGSMVAQYRQFAAAFAPEAPLICYAVKANSNLAVLRLFAGLGAGADVVSEGELRRALEIVGQEVASGAFVAFAHSGNSVKLPPDITDMDARGGVHGVPISCAVRNDVTFRDHVGW